jgi:hypothetical protein
MNLRDPSPLSAVIHIPLRIPVQAVRLDGLITMLDWQ